VNSRQFITKWNDSSTIEHNFIFVIKSGSLSCQPFVQIEKHMSGVLERTLGILELLSEQGQGMELVALG
jgi:hypothetical protein